MKILVTGSSGFIGGAVYRRAPQLGWKIRGIGRRKLDDPDYVSKDLSQPFDLDYYPDVVIHAAARSSPWGRRSDFEKQIVTATKNVIDYCNTHGQPQLIYISSGAVLYRNEHQLEIDEQTPVPAVPINEYARAKCLAEKLVQNYPGEWCILRPRAVFGPGDTVVFPRILRAMELGRLPLIKSDRVVVGDLVFIDTLVEYIIRAADRRAKGIYHISNGEPVEIYAFLAEICTELGLPLPTREVDASKAMRAARVIEVIFRLLPFLGEPPITQFGVSVFAYSKTFNTSRVQHDLGTPLVNMEEGLKLFLAWQRAQLRKEHGLVMPNSFSL